MGNRGGGCVWCEETGDEKEGGWVPICCAIVARAERVNPTGSSLHCVWFNGQQRRTESLRGCQNVVCILSILNV